MFQRTSIKKPYLSRTKFEYLQTEMYCYKDMIKKLNNKELLTYNQIEHIDKMTDAINKSLDILESTKNGELKRKIIEDMYWYSRSKSHYALAYKYNIHDNTLRNWQNEFFELFAQFMGLTI